MNSNILKAALAVLFAASRLGTSLSAPALPTFNDATVWCNPPTVAAGSTEQVTVVPDSNLLLPTDQPGDWGFAPKDPALDKIAVEDNAVHVTLGSADGTDWHFQVGQNKIGLVDGKTYVLTFRAKADSVRTISVHSQIVGGDWHSVGLDADVPLTTAWQPSKITFVAKNPSDNAQLAFNIGQQNGSIWLADVVLTPQIATAPTSTATTALKVNVTTKGDNALDVQTISKPFPLVKGTKYTLSFTARADASRKGLIAVRINVPDYRNVSSDYDPNIVFGTAWHSYSISFVATNPGDVNVVAISLGNQVGATWIANLSLDVAATQTADANVQTQSQIVGTTTAMVQSNTHLVTGGKI